MERLYKEFNGVHISNYNDVPISDISTTNILGAIWWEVENELIKNSDQVITMTEEI